MEKVLMQKELKKQMLSYHKSKGRDGKRIVGKDEDADAISNEDKLKQLANAELYMEGMLLAQEEDARNSFEARNKAGTWPWVSFHLDAFILMLLGMLIMLKKER